MKASETDVKASLMRALSGSVVRDVCRSLTQLIDSCGNQSLEIIFQDIMDDIIFNKSTKWGLKRENLSREDSLCVREFMGLQGPLFRLINRMMQLGIQCIIPVPYLSEYHEGTNKMSAFEAYFVYLAHFITMKPTFLDCNQDSISPQLHSKDNNPEDLLEAPYFTLLDEYLTHYFPISSDTKPPAVNLGLPLKASPKPYRTFAKSSSLLRQSSNKTLSCHGETLCCDVLSQLFSKMWMETYFNKIAGNMEHKLPSQNHVRAIRLLVKHIHFFYNAHTENIRHLRSDSLWEQVNPGMMNMFAPKLYDFLLHCFDIWPRDETFRIVLETWLTFIQPWRYLKRDLNIRSDSAVSNEWYWFVYQHRMFYSTLFQVIVKRLKCMDLSTPGNSLQLFRVAKVFRQPNLITLIDQAHEVSIREISKSYGSYLMSSSITKTASDDNMFSPEFTDFVKCLMDTINQALQSVKSMSGDDATSDFSAKTLQFLGYGAMLDSTPNQSRGCDAKRTQKYLEFSMAFFAVTYDLPIPKCIESHSASPVGVREIADHMVDDNGRIVLSPKGRYQLQNNLRKFPVKLHTDPELWPICSYESAILVRFFFSVASKFNGKYQDEIQTWCRKGNFMGKLCRRLFVPQANFSQFVVNDPLKPRLSLRFLAHYRNLFYGFLLYVFSWLFGFSFPLTLFYVMCLVALTFILQVLFSAEK